MIILPFLTLAIVALTQPAKAFSLKSLSEEKISLSMRQYRHSSLLANCHRSCKTCTGSNQFSCSSCYDDEDLIISQNPDDQKYGLSCVTNNRGCKNGTFYSFTQKKCLNCHMKCRTCSDSDEKSCYSCSKESTIERWSGNKYVCNFKKCPKNTYRDKRSGKCEACHPTCNGCTSAKESACTSCKAGLVYRVIMDYDYNNIKVCAKSGCVLGEFNNPAAYKCDVCHQACYSCSSSSQNGCTSCAPGYKLVNKDGGKTCIKDSSSKISCSSSQYYDKSLKKCQNCNSICKTCRGPGISCSSCPANYFIEWTQSAYIPKTLTCKKAKMNCGVHQFQDRNKQKCMECHEVCATCKSAGAQACDTCARGYRAKLIKGKRICEKTAEYCSSGKFYDRNKRKCRACNAACKECDDELYTGCISCKNGLKLVDEYNMKVKRQGKTCVNPSKPRKCSDGSFLDAKTNECRRCYGSCATCVKYERDNCLTCASGYKMASTFLPKIGSFKEICRVEKKICKVNEKYVEFKSGPKCIKMKCDAPCKTCYIEGSGFCSSCNQGYQLVQNTSRNWVCVQKSSLGHNLKPLELA